MDQHKSYRIDLVIGTIVGMGILTSLFCYGVVYPFLERALIGDYEQDTYILYRAWYDIYVEKPQRLVEFIRPYSGEWGITAKYQYGVDHSVVESEYDNVFQKLNWSLKDEVGQTKTYVKDDLICDLTELDNNIWEVKIHVKGYHDKGFWEKLIYGNTKPK